MAVRDNGFDKRPQDINRKGRPKKEYCLTDILKEQGNLEDVETKDGKISRKQAVARKLWAMAMDGDATILKYLYDRIDGTPRQTISTQVTQIDNPIFNMLNQIITDQKSEDEEPE